jgi:Mn2+/Fe2+ NRAMP family transporter
MKNNVSKKTRNIFLIFSIIGPGLITVNAGNDAGGIATYASVGASYGYKMLWGLLIITFSLAVIQEMNARMAVITGKGLSDLIREKFGVKWTFFAMVILQESLQVWSYLESVSIYPYHWLQFLSGF